MTVRSGDLRHRLTLEAPVTTPDGAGGSDLSWTAETTLWAAITPISAGERDIADGLQHRITHRIVMRHRAGVTTDRRLRHGSQVFAIRSLVDTGERGVWLECLVEEQTP